MLPQSAPSKPIRKSYLTRRGDFLRSYKGLSIRKELLVLYVRPNGGLAHRFGVTTPKTVGSAVIRNRFKRWSREFYRKLDTGPWLEPMDLHVFVGNKRLKKEDFEDVSYKMFNEQLKSAFQAALKSPRTSSRTAH